MGLIGDYDYKYLFLPDIPFVSKEMKTQPFFGLDSDVPIFLGFVLGFQHALAMLGGIVTPPITISSSFNFSTELLEYAISVSLIMSAIFTFVQITRFRVYKTPYHIGTGILSVVGTSFATLTVVQKGVPLMYESGICSKDGDKKLPCPDGYGYVLGTSCVCGLLEMLIAFIPIPVLQRIFPAVVTGPVVLMIGISLIQDGFTDWAGGSDCKSSETCGKSHPLPWGSAEFIGLGFSVYVTIIICERWGAPIMKSCAVIIGLLVGCIIAAACGYFSHGQIDTAPVATFMWVHTFKLRVWGPLVLPFLAVYLILAMEAIGDITATSDVSRLEIEGPVYDSRIQGGVLADGLSGVLSGLFMTTNMSTLAQNNGVISITKCANRTVGYWCVFFLIIMGIFAKFAGAIISIPKCVFGGMTSFLFTSVAVSGLKIISSCEFTRRDRFVLTATLVPGFGSILVPTWFDHVFTYKGNNNALRGFLDAIVLVMETSYAIGGFIGVIVNLIIPQVEDDVEDINELALETVGSADQRAVELYRSQEENKLASISSANFDARNNHSKNYAIETVHPQ